MKGDKMAKRSSFGSMVRRRLSDITNSFPKSPSFSEKMHLDNVSPREYIDHLVEEKMALVKLIQEKNKIIELSGTEIKNLRGCLQKMQIQNWTLAQTNSHMLAEVNTGKQRLKALQHELVCKDTILKAKNLQMKGEEEVNVQKTVVEVCMKESEELTEDSEIDEDTRPRNAGRRRRHSRSASLGSLTSQQHVEKEAAVSKRRCLRRQSSAGSRTKKDDDSMRNLFEIDISNTQDAAAVGVEVRSSSISRPLRKSVEKVQSYKEIPLNIKMRRSQ